MDDFMNFKQFVLSDVASVSLSNVDKKTNSAEAAVKLCNYVDVYNNYAITTHNYEMFMDASANYTEIEKFTLKKGDIAITKDSETRDDIGIPCYVANNFDDTVLLGYHCALIRCNSDLIDSKYLVAYLNSNIARKYFAYNATGSGQRASLSKSTIENMPIFAPSLQDQKMIGCLLSDIDKQICLNRQINDNLEAMARQLYEYWFIQFEFPDENGRPYKSSGGKMVWSDELNQYIPYGWKASQIKDFIASNVGGTWGNDICEYGDVKVSCIRGADIDSFKSFPTRFIKEKQLKLLLKPMDLVVEVSGGSPTQSTGRIAIITNELLNSYDDSVICSNFCRAITLKDNGYSSYFYYLWKLFYDQGVMFNFEGKTTGIKNLQTDLLFQTNVVKPNKDVASKFNQIIINIKSLQCNNINDNEFYINLRNILNKILMTGQVTVNYHL